MKYLPVLLACIFSQSLSSFGQSQISTDEVDSTILSATENAFSFISLGNLIQQALSANPDILAARANWSQAVESFPLETALDDPMLMYSYDLNEMDQKSAVEWIQTFPFPGVLAQKGRVVEKDIQIAELQYERIVRDVIADLKEAVYELIYLDGTIEITRQNQDLLSQILDAARTRYSAQQAALNDVLRAESQLAQLEYDLITIRELRAVQASVINAILNQPLDQPQGSITAGLPPLYVPTVEQLDELALNYAQEIQLAQLGVEKAHEMLRLSHRENLPMFTVRAMYMQMGRMAMDEDAYSAVVGAGITVPLWLSKNRARVRIAEEEKQKMAHEHNAAQNMTQVEIRRTYFQVQNARRLVELYRDHLLPQARQSMQIAEEWTRGDAMSGLSELLEIQSVWLNFNLAHLRAQADHAEAVTRLEKIIGGSLDPRIGEIE